MKKKRNKNKQMSLFLKKVKGNKDATTSDSDNIAMMPTASRTTFDLGDDRKHIKMINDMHDKFDESSEGNADKPLDAEAVRDLPKTARVESGRCCGNWSTLRTPPGST